VGYAEYFFPGALALILLFTAIFTTISIIEDRREGFLQAVLVAPIPRWSMVLGKVLGGTCIAVLQGAVFLALGLGTLSIPTGPITVLGPLLISAIMAFSLTSLGFVIAWKMDSVQGFHAIMSLFLMPMWLLSGAFFPAADNWLGVVIRLNPLTYGVAILRQFLYFHADSATQATALPAGLPSLGLSWLVILAFGATMFALSCRIANVRTTGDML
jgi:ABC-2 type transport system permease protein